MGAAAAVSVDDDLAARQTRVAVGTADDKFARGVHVQDVVVVDQSGQLIARPLQTCLDARNQNRADILPDPLLHHALGLFLAARVVGRDELVVLGRHHDGVDAQRTPRGIVVLDGHLTLRVGTQVGHHFAFAADDGQLLQDHVREDQRRRHVFAGLVAGVAEHDALVAGTLRILLLAHDTLVDVGRLLVDGREDAARRGIELIGALVVADPVDHAAGYPLHIDIGLRAHLARHNHQTGGAEGFAGDLRIGVVTQELIENGIGNLIRDLVGVSFRHRLRRK